VPESTVLKLGYTTRVEPKGGNSVQPYFHEMRNFVSSQKAFLIAELMAAD
jgi:hypothetical protein